MGDDEATAGEVSLLTQMQSTAERKFPMYVLRVQDILELTSLQTHEELAVAEKLVEWTPGCGDCIFISHTWLRHRHPDDAEHSKLKLLQQLLESILDGTASDITADWALAFSFGGDLVFKADKMRKSLANDCVLSLIHI